MPTSPLPAEKLPPEIIPSRPQPEAFKPVPPPVESMPEMPRETETPAERVLPLPEKEGRLEDAIQSLTRRLKKPKKIKPTSVPVVRDALTIQVEKIMEEDLKDAFRELTPVQKQEFKIAGEKTAYKIRQLLRHTHVKIKKIFQLIFAWLRLLPGINKFFLEQEAKIKADKILSLKKMNQEIG